MRVCHCALTLSSNNEKRLLQYLPFPASRPLCISLILLKTLPSSFNYLSSFQTVSIIRFRLPAILCRTALDLLSRVRLGTPSTRISNWPSPSLFGQLSPLSVLLCRFSWLRLFSFFFQPTRLLHFERPACRIPFRSQCLRTKSVVAAMCEITKRTWPISNIDD